MKKFLFILLSVCSLISSCGVAQTAAEKAAKAEEIARSVHDFNFTFKATYAYPMGYKSVYLSPYYDVKVSKDTVRAYLPYFGRAYVAPIGSNDGGIKFTSTDFSYSIADGKQKGNRIVEIRTNDTNRQIVLSFDIWENGAARLNVSDQNRQPISFQGSIETGKEE